MELIEIRDLDGPNIFLLAPAIKVELSMSGDLSTAVGAVRDALSRCGMTGERFVSEVSLGRLLTAAVAALHEMCGAETPPTITQAMETPGHLSVAFGWRHRRFAMALADLLARIVTETNVSLDDEIARCRGLLASQESDDAPACVWDADRRVRTIAVTGTNGKTTTTRLIAHILRATGRRVGWSSSSGVYIDGEPVVLGDYSGPSGGRRVLMEPGLDAAVLETARGGILLRGVAYESNDVSVFTNISADHLDLQGVRTVEGLARAKSVVVRVTRADGFAVINADDPLVETVTRDLRAPRLLVSRAGLGGIVRAHVETGGRALVLNDGVFHSWRDGAATALIAAGDVPITHGGRAPHMVENALCAAAACLAFGLSPDEVTSGLKTFRNSPEQNIGRLNVIRAGGRVVVVDYAHNEAGLSHLIAFARGYIGAGGKLVTIIGTAGDRTEHSLREIGRVAAAGSDAVIVKGTERYLRGREYDDLIRLYLEGIAAAGREPAAIEPLELPAVKRALALTADGDAVAIMAQEQIPEILAYLREIGGVAEG